MDQPKSKIDNTTASLMIGTALFFDVLSVIPIVNFFSSFFAFMTFSVWFMIKGVGLINPKKLATPVISVIIELIPAVSAIPSITLTILVTISIIKKEEGGLIGKIIDPNVINLARNKVSRVKNPDVITPSRKTLEVDRIQTKELREVT